MRFVIIFFKYKDISDLVSQLKKKNLSYDKELMMRVFC